MKPLEFKALEIPFPILKLNEPNRNGRIYSTISVQDAIDRLEKNEVWMYPDEETFKLSPFLKQIVGSSKNFRIEQNLLIADHTIIVEIAKIALERNACIRPIATGDVDSKGLVSNYRILATTIIFPPREETFKV